MKRKYADGGKVKPEYPKPTYMGAVKDRVKEMVGLGGPKMGDARKKRIDDAVNKAQGYRDGGMVGKLVKKHKC